MNINPFDQIDRRLDQIEEAINRLLKKDENPQKIEEIPEMGGIELAMQLTGKAKQTIYQLVSKRRIPHYRKSGKLYFSRSDLLEWIKSGAVPTIEQLKSAADQMLSERTYNLK